MSISAYLFTFVSLIYIINCEDVNSIYGKVILIGNNKIIDLINNYQRIISTERIKFL